MQIQIGLQEKEEKKEEEGEKKMEEKPITNNSVLHFENREEKILVIASYLESVLGPEGFDSYREFARQTNQTSKEQIL